MHWSGWCGKMRKKWSNLNIEAKKCSFILLDRIICSFWETIWICNLQWRNCFESFWIKNVQFWINFENYKKKTFQTGKSAHSCPSSVVTAELALVFYAPHTERNVCTNQITLFISLYLFFCSCVRGRRKNWCTPCCCCCYGWLCWCCFSLLQEKLQQVSNFKRFYKIIASLLFYFQITLFKLSISTASKCTETMKCKLKSP